MGLHQYGKRSRTPGRKLITRPVPPIVTEALWNKAQQTLRQIILFSRRQAQFPYLLRAKVKCGLCGLTYIGTNTCRPNGKREFYYICNGKHGARGLYGAMGQRCPGKTVNGSYLETLIWRELEGFLRDPDSVLEQLHRRIAAPERSPQDGVREIVQLGLALKNKEEERSRVLALFRRGAIDNPTLDGQLKEIAAEEAELRILIQEAQNRGDRARNGAAALTSAKSMLEELRNRLDEGQSWEEEHARCLLQRWTCE
jgi:site-specific DNA recombinase